MNRLLTFLCLSALHGSNAAWVRSSFLGLLLRLLLRLVHLVGRFCLNFGAIIGLEQIQKGENGRVECLLRTSDLVDIGLPNLTALIAELLSKRGIAWHSFIL